MTITTGTRFGPYQIAAPLGKGGMGEVYLAEDERLKRKVALKLLPAEFTQNSERLRRFEQEAQATSALNHPNIITIFEIGAQNGTHFITTEFIAGQTLRDRLQQPLSQTEATEVAVQIANALAAAHDANIIHRDIKPENVMLRKDGIVKVLDFGLAKLTERRGEGARGRQGEEADTWLAESPRPPVAASHSTTPGTVMGTASYMSPEQARGERVDARTDIFSLGVVLYEMLAGKRPFEGVNMIDVLGSILHQEPAPLGNVPDELQRIVTLALQKDRNARYASVKALQADLKAVQRKWEFTAEAQRRAEREPTDNVERLGAQASRLLSERRDASDVVSASAEEKAISSQGERAALRPLAASGTLALPGAALPGAARRTRNLLLALAGLLLIAVAAYFFTRQPTPAFREREPLLLADFENKTGEEIWDGTLKQALAVALEQSPYMNIFPEERARDTLRLMNRSVDEPLTRATGREICQRRNVRALLIGTITKLERSYTVTLEATNAQSGETMARALETAAGRDEVLNALGHAAKDLREKLGESLVSLQKYDAPLREATTKSLEALKAYSAGMDALRKGEDDQGILLLKRAVELDEQFVMALTMLGARVSARSVTEAVSCYKKGWEFRNKVSEREKLSISSVYYGYVTGELDKAIEEGQVLASVYPEDGNSFNSQGARYSRAGQLEKAAASFREAFNRVERSVIWRGNLAATLIRLNRYDEAKELLDQGVKLYPEGFNFSRLLFLIAVSKNDTQEMNRLRARVAENSTALAPQLLHAQLEVFTGRRQQASNAFQQLATSVGTRNQTEDKQRIYSNEAAAQAYFGQMTKAAELAMRVLLLQKNSKTLLKAHLASSLDTPWAGWILALSGDAARARTLTDELVRENPKNTLILNVIAPLTRATIELQRGNPAQAIELLQPAIQYEAAPASSFRPNWIRGQAYLQLKQGAQAAAEFQKIIDHRGWDVTSPLWPLAHLGAGRAAVLQSDTAKAKQMYDEFFRLWRDADADLPVLIEAKKEYEKLKSQ
ncbi:MAG: protein kinase [Blastocatellia bacterium]|nr:protein kinase [Blastocatellia bacterium]